MEQPPSALRRQSGNQVMLTGTKVEFKLKKWVEELAPQPASAALPHGRSPGRNPKREQIRLTPPAFQQHRKSRCSRKSGDTVYQTLNDLSQCLRTYKTPILQSFPTLFSPPSFREYGETCPCVTVTTTAIFPGRRSGRPLPCFESLF